MKTKTRKTTRILCASTIAAMTMLGSVAPALTTVAADGEINLGVANNIITFDKKIYLEQDENVPNATIDYKLTSRTADKKEKDALAAEGYHNVVDGTKKLESSSTTFSAGDSADTGKDYVSKKAYIDAKDLLPNLTKPTVFTYTLTEDVQGAAKGFVTPKKGDSRKLNIYVGYADGSDKLSVLYSTLAWDNGQKEEKAVGFENNYETDKNDDKTNAIKVTKKVTGNQGDKTKKFNFTVTITGQHSKVTAYSPDGTKSNSDAPVGDVVTVKTQLADDESLNLKGLTKGATYTVKEDQVDENQDGYKTTYTKTTPVTGGVEETVVTNDRSGAIPTGIYLNHKLPFNILGVALAGGAVALIAKKRHEALEDEDDE